jgi:hypothetical protein
MDRDWMREKLESFRALCEAYDQEDRQSSYGYTDKHRELNSQINASIPTVKEIVGRLDGELVSDITEPQHMSGTSHARRAVERALGILRDQGEWTAKLAPDAPSLVADQFHAYVWEAAAAIWETGNHRVAVQQAAVSLSTHIAAKAGSSLTERGLVQQVFSPNAPSSGQVRLHLPGNKSTDTWKSRQEGLHLIAQGAFAGIRNVATHASDEWPEQVALEHLAVLSVVARWTDETEVEGAS